MTMMLAYPSLCEKCRYPARSLSDLFLGGGWLKVCMRCDSAFGGPLQFDPAGRVVVERQTPSMLVEVRHG